MMESSLHFASAIIIVLSALVPIYLTIKLKSNNLRQLTLILSIFILIHSVYHMTAFFVFSLLADGVFEPLSAAVLIFFGIVYSGSISKPKNVGMKNMAVVAPVAANYGTLLLIMNGVTVILLLMALGIFIWLAARSKNIRSFQSQISIFIVIWILGDMVSILQDNGIVVFSYAIQRGDVGSEIHVVSMVFFSIMLWLRYYYSERSVRKMVEVVNVGVDDSSSLK